MGRKALFLGLGLMGLAVLVALALAYLGSFPSGGASRRTSSSPPPRLGGQSAQEAYVVARSWAEERYPDSGVVSVSASLHGGDSPAGWTFQFYSPAKKRVSVILVEGPEVEVLQEVGARYPQETLPPDAWQVDSNDLLAEWWEGNGRNIWTSAPDHNLYAQLSSRKDGSLTWKLSVINSAGQLVDVWEVNATSGERILNE
jgi:hypothetical protein